MAMVFGVSASLLLAALDLKDYYDTSYASSSNMSWPELDAYGKDDRAAELRAWHWDRAMALWPEQRRLQDERYLLTLSSRKRTVRSTARPRHSFVVRHRSRQVRLYL